MGNFFEDAFKNLNLNYEPLIDWSEELKKREEQKRKEEAIEQERINKMTCPVCKSTEKKHFIQSKNNGVIGPGSRSYVVNEYYICQQCGSHYSDLNKKK